MNPRLVCAQRFERLRGLVDQFARPADINAVGLARLDEAGARQLFEPRRIDAGR